MSRLSSRLRSEAGETLVELLLTIAIVAVTATAVLGGLATSVSASGRHRAIAAVDTLLKSYAENAKYRIDLKATPLYVACPTAPATYTSTYTNSALGWSYPAGYTTGYSVAITKVEPWNMSTRTFDAAGSCTTGLQRITVTATGPTNVADTLQIVVRDPAFSFTFNQTNAGF